MGGSNPWEPVLDASDSFTVSSVSRIKLTLRMESEFGVKYLDFDQPDEFGVSVGPDGCTRVEFSARVKAPPARAEVADIKVAVSKKIQRNAAGTSWAAAYAQTPTKSQRYYRIIFRVLEKYGPLTDDEIREKVIAADIAHSDAGLRSRRNELVAAGWVQATTIKRPSKNGHPSTVWAAVPERL